VLCSKLFSNLKILTLQTQYILSLLCFVCNNDWYIQNLDIHGRNTRYGSDFHYSTSKLAFYHKSIYYMGLKGFNSLPSYIKDIVQDIEQFRLLIKNFLYCNTFYTLDEYFNYSKKENTLWRFLTYPTLYLLQTSDASACLIIILIVHFLCLLSYSYYSSIWYWCTLTKALGYACTLW